MKQGIVVWLTGLSGAGKSTIAVATAEILIHRGFSVQIVDGDEVRRTRTANLSFSKDDIVRNNAAIVEICAERIEHCNVVFVTVVSPLHSTRRLAHETFGEKYFQVYVKASLEAVTNRDPKGLYQRAKRGEIGPMIGMTGGVPYEIPDRADLVLDTEQKTSLDLGKTLADSVTAWLQRGVPSKSVTTSHADVSSNSSTGQRR